MLEIIETREDGQIISHGQVHEDDAKARVYNIKRRVAVVGEVSTREVEVAPVGAPVVENDYVAAAAIDEASPAGGGYITFAEAAELLGIRYQQVFQKAVVKGKLRWQQTTSNFVSLADVQKWAQERIERKAKAGA
jgi:hypothetical protein